MRRSRPVAAFALISCATVFAVLGCDDRSPARVGDPPALPHSAGSSVPSRAAGVTKDDFAYPRPNLRTLAANLVASYPDDLRRAGRRGAVLVDVSVDESGGVRDIAVARPRPLPPGSQIRAIAHTVDSRTGRVVETDLPNDYDDTFGPAARDALRRTPFKPATLGGKAIPYTLRMTVRFGDSPQAR
jgi:hypothetical protein